MNPSIEVFHSDTVQRPAGNSIVSVAPRGMPLWVGDGGGIGNALLFFLLMRVLPERRGFVVAVRRRRGMAPPKVVAFECHRSADVANARAVELDGAVRAGALDANRALSRAERRAAVASALKPGG